MNDIKTILEKCHKDHFITLRDVTDIVPDNFIYPNVTGGFLNYFTGLQSLQYDANTVITSNFNVFNNLFSFVYNSSNNNFVSVLNTEDNLIFLNLHLSSISSETSYTDANFLTTTRPEENAINQLASLHSEMLSTGFHLNYPNNERFLTTMNNIEYSLLLFKKFKMSDYYNSALALPLYLVIKNNNNIKLEKYCDSYMINFYYNIFDDDYAEKLYHRRENINNKNNAHFNFIYFKTSDIESVLNIPGTYTDVNVLNTYIENKNKSDIINNLSIMANRNSASHYIIFNVYLYYQNIYSEEEKENINKNIIYSPNESNIICKKENNNPVSIKLKSDSTDPQYNIIDKKHNNILYETSAEGELMPITQQEIEKINEMINNKDLFITNTYAKFSEKNYAFYQYIKPNQEKIDQIGFIYLIIIPNFIICYNDAIMKAEGNIKYTSVKFVSENPSILV